MPRHAATMCFSTHLGTVELEASAVGVTRVRFNGGGRPREVGDGAALQVARIAREEIQAFLDGVLRAFSVPVAMRGTAFQKAVWNELRQIPYGETRSYGEIARRLGKARGARAVGAACRANPLALLVPCHRVVSGCGELTGFQAGVELKAALLSLERRDPSLAGGGTANQHAVGL